MGYWFETSPETSKRLSEIADLLLGFRETFHQICDHYHWSPAPGSPADQASAELPSPDPLIEDRHGETGHRLIEEVVQVYLLAASGHLGALASLYKSGEVFSSPPLLIRAVIENCAHAVWVLGENPEEPSEDRLARAYLEELLSAEEAKKNTGRMRAKSDPSYMSFEAEYKAPKRQILARFPDATSESLGKHYLCGQTLPRTCAGRRYPELVRADATPTRRVCHQNV